MSKEIELAKKLKALADRGEGGEKETAEAMLKMHLKKHGLTLEDIESEAIKEHYFNIPDNGEKLFYQIVKHVNREINVYGAIPIKMIKKHKLKGNFIIDATHSQFVEIEAMYAFYSKLFEKELEIFFSAFIQSNKLYCNGEVDINTLSEEKIEEAKRIIELSKNIESKDFRKQLHN